MNYDKYSYLKLPSAGFEPVIPSHLKIEIFRITVIASVLVFSFSCA